MPPKPLVSTHLDSAPELWVPLLARPAVRATATRSAENLPKLLDHRFLFAFAILLLPLLVGGCRSTVDTAPLEQENRYLEDRIYELEDHCEHLHDELESTRRENSMLRSDGRNGTSTEESGDAAELLTPPTLEGLPELPIQGSPSAPDTSSELSPNGSEDAPRFGPSDEPSAPADNPAPEGPPLESPSGEFSPDDSAQLNPVSHAVASVRSITLNRRLTGGHDTRPASGDEGVLVVVEPRDGSGKIVPADAAVSIGIQDPNLPGPAGQLARWDFAADESARFFRRTPMGDGLHFDLPWPNQAPQHEDLQLWVRLVTADGQKHLARRDIRVDLPVPFREGPEFDSDDLPSHDSSESEFEELPEWSPERPGSRE